jgi:hypothetical protein
MEGAFEMWLRLLCLPLIMFALQVPFSADTAQTMRQKYGPPISETYLIKPSCGFREFRREWARLRNCGEPRGGS